VSEDSRAHGYVSARAVVSKVVEMRAPATASLNLFGRAVELEIDYVRNFKILRFLGLLAGYMGFAAVFMAGSQLLFDGGRQSYGKD